MSRTFVHTMFCTIFGTIKFLVPPNNPYNFLCFRLLGLRKYGNEYITALFNDLLGYKKYRYSLRRSSLSLDSNLNKKKYFISFHGFNNLLSAALRPKNFISFKINKSQPSMSLSVADGGGGSFVRW